MSEGYFLFSHASPLPQLCVAKCFSRSKWSSCWREPPSPPRPGTQDPECWMLVMNDKVQALPSLVFLFFLLLSTSFPGPSKISEGS